MLWDSIGEAGSGECTPEIASDLASRPQPTFGGGGVVALAEALKCAGRRPKGRGLARTQEEGAVGPGERVARVLAKGEHLGGGGEEDPICRVAPHEGDGEAAKLLGRACGGRGGEALGGRLVSLRAEREERGEGCGGGRRESAARLELGKPPSRGHEEAHQHRHRRGDAIHRQREVEAVVKEHARKRHKEDVALPCPPQVPQGHQGASHEQKRHRRAQLHEQLERQVLWMGECFGCRDCLVARPGELKRALAHASPGVAAGEAQHLGPERELTCRKALLGEEERKGALL